MVPAYSLLKNPVFDAQPLKGLLFEELTASLKRCPDTKRGRTDGPVPASAEVTILFMDVRDIIRLQL
jgi:hypothetical protein